MFWSRKYCRDIYSSSTKASLNRNVTAVGRAVTLLSGAGNFSEFVNYPFSLDKSFSEPGVCLELLCAFGIMIKDWDCFRKRFPGISRVICPHPQGAPGLPNFCCPCSSSSSSSCIPRTAPGVQVPPRWPELPKGLTTFSCGAGGILLSPPLSWPWVWCCHCPAEQTEQDNLSLQTEPGEHLGLWSTLESTSDFLHVRDLPWPLWLTRWEKI